MHLLNGGAVRKDSTNKPYANEQHSFVDRGYRRREI